MLNPLYSLCVYLAEMVITYIFLSNIFESRFSPIKCLLIGTCLFVTGSALNLVLQNNVAVNFVTAYLVVLLFALFAFRATMLSYFFNAAILVIGNMALEMGAIAISSFLFGNGFMDYNSNLTLFLCEAISSKSLLFLYVLIVIKLKSPKGTPSKVPTSCLIYPASSTFCLFIFWYVCTQPKCPGRIQLLLAIAGGGLFVASILLFVSFSHQVEKENEAMQVKGELARIRTEQSYYQILDQQNQQLMIYAHDAKNHLAAIQSLNTDPQISNYISKLSQQLAEYTHHCHSGNKLLDVMIHKYCVDCEMRGIAFEYDIKLCNLSGVEDMDLVAILGNLMDNAVAAAERSAHKRISLATARRNSYSILVITNSSDMQPNGIGTHLVTSKPDEKLHGFGLKSVRKTLKKYQGDFEWDYDSNAKTFTVTAMLSAPAAAVGERP